MISSTPHQKIGAFSVGKVFYEKIVGGEWVSLDP